MYAICCDKEEEKNPLEASKCHICCHNEGGGGAWGEDGLEEIGKEGRHFFLWVGFRMGDFAREGERKQLR